MALVGGVISSSGNMNFSASRMCNHIVTDGPKVGFRSRRFITDIYEIRVLSGDKMVPVIRYLFGNVRAEGLGRRQEAVPCRAINSFLRCSTSYSEYV